MSDMYRLQMQQRRLLQDWLLANDGETRFLILNELRTVENDLIEIMRHHHIATSMIHKFAVNE